MNEAFRELFVFLTPERAVLLVRACVILILGLLIAKLAAAAAVRLARKHLAIHETILIKRGIFYSIVSVFLVSSLHQLGFNLGVLLGAAGIISVSLGFAAQTSASNLISGLFLIGERPFSVGDIVRFSDVTGEVLSIDLLSVKIRTFDNLYVRIPNETVVKSTTTTLTKFPIRRIDIEVGVAYKEDLERVHDVLMKVADKNPLCLEEPKPLFIFLGFGDSSLDIQFSVWGRRDKFLELRTAMRMEIKRAFDREGIEIPFPHRTLYTGSVTDPMPVKMVRDIRDRKTEYNEGER